MWFIGFMVGVFASALLVSTLIDIDRNDCEKRHNVYKCEIEWVPSPKQN